MKLRNLRWWIAGLLFFASVLNYVDRQTLSILAPTIQKDLHLSDQQYGNVVSWFLVAYTVAYLLSGRLVDALGSRVSMAIFVGWWSVSNGLTGFARSFGTLSIFRSLLGLGEAGAYTASPRVAAEWFPARDRGVAVGIYSVGGTIGATLAPVVVVAITEHFGWRWAFAFPSLLGVTFVGLWLAFFRVPGKHPWITESERILIEEDSAPAQASAHSPHAFSERDRWRAILVSPTVWSLMIARLLTDPVWYFFQFWLPKYLHTVRGFDQHALERLWIVFLAAGVGGVGSGFVSGKMVRSGTDAPVARLRTMLLCVFIVPVAAFIPVMPTGGMVLAVSSVAVFAQMAWLSSITTYVVEIVDSSMVGTAFGFIAAGSAVGGILMNSGVVWCIDHVSYDVCFYTMLGLHVIAYMVVRAFGQSRLVVR